MKFSEAEFSSKLLRSA